MAIEQIVSGANFTRAFIPREVFLEDRGLSQSPRQDGKPVAPIHLGNGLMHLAIDPNNCRNLAELTRQLQRIGEQLARPDYAKYD